MRSLRLGGKALLGGAAVAATLLALGFARPAAADIFAISWADIAPRPFACCAPAGNTSNKDRKQSKHKCLRDRPPGFIVLSPNTRRAARLVEESHRPS